MSVKDLDMALAQARTKNLAKKLGIANGLSNNFRKCSMHILEHIMSTSRATPDDFVREYDTIHNHSLSFDQICERFEENYVCLLDLGVMRFEVKTWSPTLMHGLVFRNAQGELYSIHVDFTHVSSYTLSPNIIAPRYNFNGERVGCIVFSVSGDYKVGREDFNAIVGSVEFTNFLISKILKTQVISKRKVMIYADWFGSF